MRVLPESFLKCMRPEDRAPLGKAGRTSAEADKQAVIKSERELQNLLANWFKLNGIPAFRQRMDKKSNMDEGTPDFLVCYKGCFVGLECKVGNNKATPEQVACMNAIISAGGNGHVVKSLQDVKDILNNIYPLEQVKGLLK